MKKSALALGAFLLAAAAPMPFMPGVVSTAENEYNLSVTRDGQTMVFARSGAEFAGARILVMVKEGSRWSDPQPVPFAVGRYRHSDPWLTPDGRWLYFISDRPAPAREGDRRDLDIWRVARLPNGAWGVPQYLEGINSPGEELGPELHGGVLYFNSTRRGGPGNLDIYGASQRPDGSFEEPQPLPAPINTAQAEGDFTLSPNGAQAFFWSTRGGKAGLWSATRVNGGWAEPKSIEAVDDGSFVFTPALVDGRLAYASTRKHKHQPDGMADIYIEEPTSSGRKDTVPAK